MTTLIIVIFVIGYAAIALEHNLKINKSATALFMCVVCWALYAADCHLYIPLMHPGELQHFIENAVTQGSETEMAKSFVSQVLILEHMGDVAEIVFFLLGAMTIVEIVDSNGGFSFVRDKLLTRSKRTLLWRITIMTFFLSAILDNLTTTIVMLMVSRKLVFDQRDRWYYAALIILSANAGGAFSPIGDVTTIMLWIRGNITTIGVISEVFLPSVVAVLIPALILQYHLKGELSEPEEKTKDSIHHGSAVLTAGQSRAIFFVGVGGLICVPFFREFTGLPPFMGILMVFSLLWILTEIFLSKHTEDKAEASRVTSVMRRIDLSTILFFLGILMAVAAIQETGTLQRVGEWLSQVADGNAYIITGAIGVLSAIVDNVPLVASCMAMYDITPAGSTDPMAMQFMIDGQFWQLLAYCAGVGGSMLIIGSAAGVVAMGIEKITFGWYFKNITWIAFVGYIGGMATYWLVRMVIG